MAEDEKKHVGYFEGGMPSLPTQVLSKACMNDVHPKNLRNQTKKGGIRSAAIEKPPLLHSNSRSIPHQRPRYPTNWAAGGPGMQAVFLDSGKKSCGTGVFLPRRAGVDLQLTNKPACSPVLLPSRVVQTLNLNVHELGLQTKPKDYDNPIIKGSYRSCVNSKKDVSDLSSQSCIISQNRSSSSDIFLPKEWTY